MFEICLARRKKTRLTFGAARAEKAWLLYSRKNSRMESNILRLYVNLRSTKLKLNVYNIFYKKFGEIEFYA